MRCATVLLIGGDMSLRDAVREVVATKSSFQLVEVADFRSGEARLACRDVAAALIHVRRPAQAGRVRQFLRRAGDHWRKVPVVIIHEQLDAARILDFLKQGAAECLGRPLNMSRLSLVLDMFAAHVLIPGQPAADTTGAGANSNLAPFPSEPAGWSGLMEQVRLVAPLDTTILLTGETGVGKTRLSRLIHDLSPRRSKRYVAVNCGALSATLVESELFGHVRGAFTGADRDHVGKFSQCEDGTLVLDEIDTLSLELQVKFLRVVEERSFEAVGAERSQHLRARLVVATNRSLEQEVADGRFRSDLYYRLNVVAFHLPPLRERRAEIGSLAEQFITDFARQHGLSRPKLAPRSRAALETYDWPGNVRQLRNVIERAVILSAGATIDKRLLPEPIRALIRGDSEGPIDRQPGRARNKLASARMTAEKGQLLDALRKNGNNRSRTASYLGISRVALYKRLHKFQMI